MRHSCATALLEAGVPISTVSGWLGHSGVAITMAHYAAVTAPLHVQAAQAMDRVMSGRP